MLTPRGALITFIDNWGNTSSVKVRVKCWMVEVCLCLYSLVSKWSLCWKVLLNMNHTVFIIKKLGSVMLKTCMLLTKTTFSIKTNAKFYRFEHSQGHFVTPCYLKFIDFSKGTLNSPGNTCTCRVQGLIMIKNTLSLLSFFLNFASVF